jgi:hypothetical protein
MSYRDSVPDEPSSRGDFRPHDPRSPSRRVAGPDALSRTWRGADHAHDFLGLDSEVRAHVYGAESVAPPPMLEVVPPSPASAPPPSLFDLMQPGEEELAMIANAPREQRSNSWLLALDDARSGRAGHAPVIDDPSRARSAPIPPQLLETSFHEAPHAAQRTGPWLVRILVGAAVVSIVYVTYQTLDARRHARVVPLQQPLAPVSQNAAHRGEDELADPNDVASSIPREQPSAAQHGAKPDTAATARGATPTRPGRGPSNGASSANSSKQSAAQPNTLKPGVAKSNVANSSSPAPGKPAPTSASPRSISITQTAPLDAGVESSTARAASAAAKPTAAGSNDAALPEWWSGSLRTNSLATNERGPEALDYAGSAERQERTQRWLMLQSRSASPLADASGAPPQIDPAPESLLAASMLPSIPRSVAAKAGGLATGSADSKAGAGPATAKPEPKAAPLSTMSAIWDGNTVPVEQIDSSARIATPQVGYVRVHLVRGDSVEGRLQAIGQGQLWLDAPVGRIAFAADQIDRIEQIATPSVSAPAAAPEKSAAASEAAKNASKPAPPAPGAEPKVAERVRVKTPGGIFYGRIVERDEHTVTLVTDEGAQVTVDGADVEPAPLQKTVVKHDSKGSKLSAKKPAPKPAPEQGPDADGANPAGNSPK